jgi:hypothetical protein
MVNAAVYEKLIEVAKAKKTITYEGLAQAADLSLDIEDDMQNLGSMLDVIAEQEVAAGRPLLPIVVVQEMGNKPGGGLFKFARQKGLQKGLQRTDNLTFFVTELRRVHDYWAAASG